MAFPIVPLLLQIGPTILRGIGARKGGTAAVAANAVASVLEGTQGAVTPARIEHAIASLPAAERAEMFTLINEGERIRAELKGKEIEASTREFEAEQKTHQVALQSTDVYTIRTRPLIARWSFFLSASYAIMSVSIPLLNVEVKISFDYLVYLAIASPALTYMGVRTVDKVFGLLKGRVK